MNTVDQLLATPFSGLDYARRLEVKRLGPHQPDVQISQTTRDRGKDYTRKFNYTWYTKLPWLTGSTSTQSLFCFPCLLFGGEVTWTKKGVTDLKHLSDKSKRHEATKLHMENSLQLATIGSVNIAVQLNEGYRTTISKHNEDVDKNRYILSKLIDCIRFCRAFELALRSHDESEDSSNPGIYRGLIDFVKSIDSAMEAPFTHATVFKGTSKTIQNELLDCMLNISREFIVEQLKKTTFVAIQADDATDVSTMTQTVLVLRYIDQNDNVLERFYGFINTQDVTATGIAKVLLDRVNSFFPETTDKQKVIAQTYDGSSVMRGVTGGVQRKIKEVYPNAHYVHCYAHQLNLIMTQAVSKIPKVRIFFADLSGFPPFFSRSPKRTAVLQETVNRRLPVGSTTRWNFHSHTVQTIYTYRNDLLTCYETIISSGEFDLITVKEAQGYIRTLQDKEFVFLLFLFNDIMPHVEILYNQLQKIDSDTVYVQSATTNLISCINKVRTSVDTLLSKLPQNTYCASSRTNLNSLTQIGKEACDIILVYANERFAFTKHLEGAKLLHSALFASHAKHFPNAALIAAVQAYLILQKEKLCKELSIIYERSDFRSAQGAVPLLKILRDLDIQGAFSETVSLLKILVTTPMTTAESERCFSSLKRIKTFLRNTMSEDRLNALAMLSIEKNLLNEIPEFNKKVTDRFAASKDRCMNFLYK